jgi:hypothetical protein
MRLHTTISGSELLLGVIAIRLAVLVLVGWCLTLLPPQTRNSELACIPAAVTASDAPAKIVGPHVADAALDDMRLHD